MAITLQFNQPVLERLHTQAEAFKVSVEDLIHRFVDIGLGHISSNHTLTPPSMTEPTQLENERTHEEWDEIEWVDEDEWDEDAEWDDEPWTEEDERALHEFRAKARARAAKLDLEIEEEIRREYGTGLDLVRNTAGIWGRSLPAGEVQYLIESRLT